MRMRDRNKLQKPPEVNLIPMLDVLMTVLTFFIIVAMTLAVEQGVRVQLPGKPEDSPPAQNDPEPLITKLTPQGITVNNQPMTKDQLSQQIKGYLAQNPKGLVALQAEPTVAYEQVVELLGEMKAIGGERVSLAIE